MQPDANTSPDNRDATTKDPGLDEPGMDAVNPSTGAPAGNTGGTADGEGAATNPAPDAPAGDDDTEEE